LNALQDDQARRFREWGLRATTINGPTLSENKTLLRDIRAGLYQIIITSPENALNVTMLKPILLQQVPGRRLKFIVDEAHVVKKWGMSGFRQDYARCGNLRAFVPQDSPFGAFSATLPPASREVVMSSLHMNPNTSLLVNKGNYRPNIILDVKHLSGSIKAIPEIRQSLPPLPHPSDIPLTIVFVNERQHGHQVYSYIKSITPTAQLKQVHFLHALRSVRVKKWSLAECMLEERGIYVCTEVAAMGCDFPETSRVLQFLLTDDFDSWMQRGGRGGRTGGLCRSTMFAQEAATQTRKRKRGANEDDDDEEISYRKKIEDPDFREFVTSQDTCLWEIVNKHYENPPNDGKAEGSTCCGVCERKHGLELPWPQPIQFSPEPASFKVREFTKELHANEMMQAVTAALTNWRIRFHQKLDLTGASFGITGIMTDRALDAIAKFNHDVRTLNDFKSLDPVWPLHTKYGNEVLAVVRQAREGVASKWAKWQSRIDEVKKAKEERERAEKERRKNERAEEAGQRDLEERRLKRARYEEEVRQGRKPRGRPPKAV